MATSDLDAFRLELGDRDSTDPLFNDNEAQYFIGLHPGNVLLAVADACDALARTFARKADVSIKSGDDAISRKYGAISKSYEDRATALRARAIANSGIPWHGGGSRSRKDDLASDPDRVQPRFGRGQFREHPGTGRCP